MTEQETQTVTFSEKERLIMQKLVSGYDLKDLDESELESARNVSLRFGGGNSNRVASIQPPLLRATYYACLTNQVVVDEISFKRSITSLTPRQQLLVKLVCEGKTIGQIRELMSIKIPEEVQTSLFLIEATLSICNRFQMVAIAARDRLFEQEN